MAICKQYIIKNGSKYTWLDLYENGVGVKNQCLALNDTNLDAYEAMLEDQGYTRAYTDAEIAEYGQEMRKLQSKYAHMCENRLMKVENDGKD